ncbi:MAG: LemA family protein [Candidatus Gracilibacteria bacterium]
MKNPIWIVLGVIGALVVMVGLWLMGSYNGLVALNESADGQWAQVESQYQRRFDLIPNLVASVQGSMQQEKDVFGLIADARTKYSGAKTVDEKVQAAGQVDSALARLLIVMENYPELKSNQNVQTLMSQLEGTENRISVERMRFNDMIKEYNQKIKTFPTVMIAGMFGFKERAYFAAENGAEKAPKVDLINK